VGWTPPPPSREAPSRSRAKRPLEQVSVSLEGITGRPPIPAPPAGAFNALTPAGIRVKGESTPLCASESCPATAPLTSRHCATLCGMVSNRPEALCHPLLYGRRTAPSKKDGGTLEGTTRNYSTLARDNAVTSGQWERSPPSPSALCDHPCHRDAILTTASPYPTLWNMRRQDTATPTTVPRTTSRQRHPRVGLWAEA
jgi:hypothetical protein